MNAITTAAGFAVFQGVFFKVSDHIENSLYSWKLYISIFFGLIP